MSKRIIKAIAAVCVFLLMICVAGQNLYADENVSVSISAADTTIDGETTVTITISGNKENVILVDLWLAYDPNILQLTSEQYQGNGGVVRIMTDSGGTTYSVKFKGIAAGTSGLAVTDQSLIGMSTTEARGVTASATVTVKGTVSQSKNNNLSSLTVTPGTLSPAFSKDVTTYNITLSEYASKLTVSAAAEDAKAKVAVAGNSLSVGKNTTTITVTAENGEQKVYTIYTQVPEKKTVEQPTQPAKDIIVEVDEVMYKVNTTFDEKLLPEGYEIQSYTYKNNKIKVGKGISNGKILFCVSNASVSKATPVFVVYNEQTGAFSKLQMITTGGQSYMVVSDVEALNSVEIPKGYVASEYVFNGITYKTWIHENDTTAQSFIIYCTNVNGEAGWYRYDMTEGTMQRAFIGDFEEDETQTPTEQAVETESETTAENVDEDKMSELQKEYDNYVKKTRLALTMMAVLLAAVIVIVVVFTVKSFKESADSDMAEEADENDDDDIENLDD